MTTVRTSLRRRVAVVGALALGLAGFVPAAAQADDDPPITVFSAAQCSSGRFCLWSGAGYTGSFWSTGSAGTQASGVTGAHSVWNRMAVTVRVHTGSGGSGGYVCYDAGDIASSVSLTSLSVVTLSTSAC
ncbi:MAG TPA: peptidase inhibitor family I36 protein [Cellulomonas sp.]